MKKDKKKKLVYYIANTILYNKESFDSKRLYTQTEINDLGLAFYMSEKGKLSHRAKKTIQDVYSFNKLDSVIASYLEKMNFDNFMIPEYILESYIFDFVVISCVPEDSVYTILEPKKVWDVMNTYVDIANEIMDDMDYVGMDDDIISMEEMLNDAGIYEEDILIINEFINEQKNSLNVVYKSKDCDLLDILKKTTGNNTSGVLVFVHSVEGMSSRFDFKIVDNEMVFVDDISSILQTYAEKCFEKGTKLMLVYNTNQKVDGLDVKENYNFNIYTEGGYYILENILVQFYSDDFLDLFNTDKDKETHYVLCDMKGGKVLTFDY
jgi:hypothetical protein